MSDSNTLGRLPENVQSLDALQAAHGDLEARLQKLGRHRSLSPEEQFEVQVLKKRKLALKDRMRAAAVDRS